MSANAPRPAQWMTLAEAAAHARAPERSVRHWIACGKLPACRPGRRLLIDLETLDAFIRSAKKYGGAL